MLDPRVPDVCVRQVEDPELGHALEVNSSGIANSSSVKIELFERNQLSQICEARVRDVLVC